MHPSNRRRNCQILSLSREEIKPLWKYCECHGNYFHWENAFIFDSSPPPPPGEYRTALNQNQDQESQSNNQQTLQLIFFPPRHPCRWKKGLTVCAVATIIYKSLRGIIAVQASTSRDDQQHSIELVIKSQRPLFVFLPTMIIIFLHRQTDRQSGQIILSPHPLSMYRAIVP